MAKLGLPRGSCGSGSATRTRAVPDARSMLARDGELVLGSAGEHAPQVPLALEALRGLKPKREGAFPAPTQSTEHF